MSDIFVSYEKSDLATAHSLAQVLVEHGWSVFWDRTISIGSAWRDTIATELQHARSVIVLWSRASTKSHWVLDEADNAKKRGILIPVLIQDTEPPLGFRSIQTGNLTGWDGERSDEAFQRLMFDLTKVLGVPKLSDSTPSPPPPKARVPVKPEPEPPPRDWRLEMLIMGSWYDRAGNEYFIGMRGTNGGRQTNLEVRQVNLNSIGAGWVEGEIVAFNCWLPQMGQFEGRLFRSSGDSLYHGRQIYDRGTPQL